MSRHIIKESSDGNVSLNWYSLGCDRVFIEHMVETNQWSSRDIVDYLINGVATALNAKVCLPTGVVDHD